MYIKKASYPRRSSPGTRGFAFDNDVVFAFQTRYAWVHIVVCFTRSR